MVDPTIQEIVPANHWYHAKSQDNSAVLVSRGIEANALKDNELWWKAPQWLRQHSSRRQHQKY